MLKCCICETRYSIQDIVASDQGMSMCFFCNDRREQYRQDARQDAEYQQEQSYDDEMEESEDDK